jgi:adhesin/invasin
MLACAGALVAVCTVAGCNKVPLLAPSGTTITLGTNSTIVQSNGTAQVTATLLESSGTPVQNGTTVTFSTNLGRLSPGEARTVNGVATATFQASGSSGVAEIRAVSGGAKPADTANPSLKITIGAAAAGRISVTASPATVAATGGNSTISATVSDTAGNALRDVPVTFSTTAGTLSTAVASTDASGNATTTLTTSRDATVTASAGAGATSGTNTGTVTVKVNVAGTVAVVVAPSPAAVGQPVSANVTLTANANGTPFQRGTVEWGDGASSPIPGSSSTVQHTYTRAGTYVVRATAFDQLGDSASSTATLVVSAALKPTVSIVPVGNPAIGGVTNFTLTVNPAPNSGATIDDVQVDFGDGEVRDLGAITGTVPIQHVYSTGGTFVVSATARDTLGGTGTGATVIVVSFTVSLSSAVNVATKTATFTANLNPANTPISNFFWNYGDGTSENSGTVNQRNHTYVLSGTYTVTVSATATNGQTASATGTIVIP